MDDKAEGGGRLVLACFTRFWVGGDILGFLGVPPSEKESIALKLPCESRENSSACSSSMSNSSLLRFLLFAARGSLRTALSSLHIARDSPNASRVLEDDV